MSPERTKEEFLKFFQKEGVDDILFIKDVKELPISVQLPNWDEADESLRKLNLEKPSKEAKRSDMEGDNSLGCKVDNSKVKPNTNY